jgi:hypothetical protein
MHLHSSNTCQSKRLTSDKYCHGDFKIDLIDGLFKLANKLQVDSGNEENQGPVTRNTSTANDVNVSPAVPPGFQSHALMRDASVNRGCMHYGKLTKFVCGFGRAIRGTQGGKVYESAFR